MRLTVVVGTLTIIDHNLGSEPSKVTVRVRPWFLSWFPIRVDVKITGQTNAAISVQM